MNAKRAQETEKTLIGELQHRSNNLLAMIQTIANRTFSDGYALGDARTAFQGRLQALARANNIVTSTKQMESAVERIVRIELEPFIERFTAKGPSIILNSRNAQSLALVLHELMTNASKYGAFSNGTGKVNFYWSVIRNGRQNKLKFRWQETGGPPVAPPKRRGFGTSLLETTFAAIRLDYPGDGLVCEFEAVLGVEHESQETLA